MDPSLSDLASVSVSCVVCTGPTSHLLPATGQLRLSLTTVHYPAARLRTLYQNGPWLSFKENKIMSREERDNERGQVSNSCWECENQERPGRT